MEDEQHRHLFRQESKNGSQAEKNSPPLHSQSKGELPVGERKSHSINQHHHHNPAHAQMTTSTATTSMISGSVIYNINIQFDPAIPQVGKPTIISLIVTEQKVGEPIKQFDIVHDKLIPLIVVNREDLSRFAHIHSNLDREMDVFMYPIHLQQLVNTRCGSMSNQRVEYKP